MEETLTVGEWILWALVGFLGFFAVASIFMVCSGIVRILFKGGK